MRRQEYTKIPDTFYEYKREDSLYTANGQTLPSQEVYRVFRDPTANEGENDERNETKGFKKLSLSVEERKNMIQSNLDKSKKVR